MKVLIASIACQPGSGSESKVGWDAIQAISENHECHVLTHTVYKDAILEAQRRGAASNVTFHFHGNLYHWHYNRLIARVQSWQIYHKWLSDLLKCALELHRRYNFDLAHHVTYATWRVPSPLWQMPIPFVWGPIGGAAQMPQQFYSTMGLSGIAFELIRNISTLVSSRSKDFLKCVENSNIVIAASAETEAFIRKYRKTKPIFKIPVAFFTKEQLHRFIPSENKSIRKDKPLKLFVGGNIIGSKGVSLAIEAVVLARKRGVLCEYTIAGGGPEIPKLTRLCQSLGASNFIHFHQGFTGEDYVKALQSSDVYLMPSFRETFAITMFEAILAGCYPIVLDTSAPGEAIKTIGGGIAVAPTNKHDVIHKLADAIEWCWSNKEIVTKENALLVKAIIENYSKDAYVTKINKVYQFAKNKV